MVKSINEYRDQGTIKDLVPIEEEDYLSFLKKTYQENLGASEYLLIKFPRWSIIAGYYAMHDISKFFLAKKFKLKFSAPHIHAAVIQTLRELVKRSDIVALLEKAEEEYQEIISLHLALLRGKDEREKSQYYTSEQVKPVVKLRKASYFLEKLVKPYLKLVEKL